MADGDFRGGDGPGRSGPHYAILEGHEVVPVYDMLTWAKWREANQVHVAIDMLGKCTVSTVFLGLNHGYLDGPLWFETFVFNGRNGSYLAERYATWSEAEAGHAFAARSERYSFRAWVHGEHGLGRILIVGYRNGHAILEDGDIVPLAYVFRNRRRVPLRKATYQRRFEAQQ